MEHERLLNPKGFAKANAKSKKKPPNYGPQQSRKPAVAPNMASTASVTKYDPTMLLNPNSSVTSATVVKDSPSNPTKVSDQNRPSMGSMIENFHNVVSREDAPSRKRKIIDSNDDDGEDASKKSKSSVSISANGGMIGDHLKSERRQLAASAGTSSEPLDLTNDQDDDDVVVTKDRGNEEVCLGVIHTYANVDRIPAVSANAAQVLGKDHWPRMKINLRRQASNNSIIELFDRANNRIGKMEARVAHAMCPILDGANVNRARFSFYLVNRARKPEEQPGMRVSQNLKSELVVYCPRRLMTSFGKYLSQNNLFLSPPAAPTGKEFINIHEPQVYGPVRAGAHKPQSGPAGNFVTRTAEEIRREANNMFDNLEQAENLPEKDANTELIRTPLMSHQKQALHFLVDHERSTIDDEDVNIKHSLWRHQIKSNGQPAWRHIITGEEVPEKPTSNQGGILADMMGLGKTLSILSLIADTHEESKRFRRERIEGDADDDTECNARATLIICPKSVLANWQEQIAAHMRSDKIKVYSYHGTHRTQDTAELAKQDIVLTSYHTVANEFSDARQSHRPLPSINWFRIVLDEAHSIRTTSTKVSKSCCRLHGQRRWAVTGTPVQNRLDDLGALVKFLRIKPLDNSNAWQQYIMAKFKSADADVIQQLQVLVGSITLRRMKDKIGLRQRFEQRVMLQFSKAERALYSQFATQSRTQLHAMSGGSNALKGRSYAHILKSISRLRAICAHGREMLTDEDMKEIEYHDPNEAIVIDLGDEPSAGNEEDFTTEKQAYETLVRSQDSETDNCGLCGKVVGEKRRSTSDPIDLTADDEESTSSSDDDEDTNSTTTPSDITTIDKARDIIGYLTPCYHLVCDDCKDKHHAAAQETMTADKYYTCTCCTLYLPYGLFPLRRSGLQRYNQDRLAALGKNKALKWDESTYSGPHTKVKALLEDLRKSALETSLLPASEPPIRSVIFSGWTSYLDLIEFALTRQGIGLVRLDGTMSVKARAAVLQTFRSDPTITVILVSIRAGGQGINLTAANKVYVMEPQFNPGVEQQAVDRVHRLGQLRDVYITHYIMAESIEPGILTLQRQKEKLAQLSLERKMSRGDEMKQRMEELKALFK